MDESKKNKMSVLAMTIPKDEQTLSPESFPKSLIDKLSASKLKLESYYRSLIQDWADRVERFLSYSYFLEQEL
jgi:hypothetical protein